MALILSLTYMDNLDIRCDRVLKLNFRDFEKTSKVVRGKENIYFGEQFEWPIGRKLDATDTLDIRLYQFNKFLTNKVIGKVTICLQQLLEEYKVSFRENLVDENHSIMRTTVSFDVTYYSPDSQVGDWKTTEFANPVIDQRLSDIDDDSMGSGKIDSDKKALIGGGGMGWEKDNESVLSDGDKNSNGSFNERNIGIPLTLKPTLHKTQDWQIAITVIEARQLAGANINPLIEVKVGDKKKTTDIQMSTNAPYYNQYLCFDFCMSKAELFDQVIHIKALAMGTMAISRILPGDLIGEFRMDIRSVYNAPDHMFMHKWAMLVDPKDILSGSKGYVKVDMNIMGEGDEMKNQSKGHTKKQKVDNDDDIEANLLLPQTAKSGAKRQMAEISVKIYKAEDLPRMNTDIMTTIKQAITGDNKPLVDPFVQVSFAGHTGKTKIKKNTYTPEWNEEVVFTESFPPLCNRIRISVYDWDAVFNECIATHFIDLNQIMNEDDTGFLPTFGPAWVNLYGTPRDYTYEQMVTTKEELNRGLGEGVAYKGRILMAIKTTLRTESSGLPAGAKVYSVSPVSDGICGKKEPFLLIGAFYEASAIDSEIGKKKLPIYFELSIGTTGNRLDSQTNEFTMDKDQSSGNQTTKPKIPKWCHSTTSPMVPDTNDEEYYHISFNERKPCLYMISFFEDHKHRLFIPNILEKLMTEFIKALESINEMIQNEKRGVHIRMRNILDKFAENIQNAQENIKNCKGVSAKTLLDKERQKLLKVCLEKMKVKIKAMRKDCTRDTLSLRLNECKSIIRKLNDLIPNPQDSIPDVFIWLIMDNKRMAFARIPARELIYSSSLEEKGSKNSEVVTIFLQKPGRQGMGQSGWALQGQLKMYLWVGLLRDMKTFQQCIPMGYDPECFKFRRPPMEIIYTERSYFQLRAHMFMARNLIGSDETGLSDAFARILINDHIVSTKVVYETLSPKWDQTLIIDHMVFYYSKELIELNPPIIVVETFDEDLMDTPEFLGRCFCKPTVAIDGDEYKMAKLTWWELFRGQSNAGELLAAFELIQVFPDECYRLANGILRPEDIVKQLYPNDMVTLKYDPEIEENNKHDGITVMCIGHYIIDVPQEIRPVLVTYRMEILFWGVRQMQRIHLLSVDKPRVTIEFGGTHLSSEVIYSCRVKPNFQNPLKYVDIMLPENLNYWPPLMIQCEDCRQFGRTVLVGNHLISTITKYIFKGKKDEPLKSKEILDSAENKDEKNNIPLVKINYDGITNPCYEDDEGRKDLSRLSIVSALQENVMTQKKGLSHHPSKVTLGPELIQFNQEQYQTQNLYPPGEMPLEMQIEEIKGKDDKQPLVKNDKVLPNITPEPPIERPKPGGIIEIKKKCRIPREELQDLDWWSRYYATMGDDDEEGNNDSNDSDIDVLKDIEVDLKSDCDDKEPILDIPEDDEKLQKKKNKKRKKQKKKVKKKDKDGKLKKLIEKLPFRKVDAAKEFFKEKDDEDLVDEVEKPSYHNLIERILIYNCALEDVKLFNGFKEFVKTFSLQKGKFEDDDEADDKRVVGYFKGNLTIYRINEEDFESEIETSNLILSKNLPSNEPIELLVRIYIIKANDLHPSDANGKSDPYLVIRLGHHVINDKENYIPKQLNPVFGKCFELDVKFPHDSNLVIQMMDWDFLSGDDLIGETRIDLENRYYSKHRAICGLGSNYENNGYNKWKDQQLPTQILAKLCTEYGLDQPKYESLINKVSVANIPFYADSEVEDDSGDKKQSNEPLALEVLKNWDKIPNGCVLVPEHIESRFLYNPEKPGIEQGNIQMWIDMFPKVFGAPPAQTNIAPRLPQGFELRIIIWNTEDVILNDFGILSGEKSSDIFVKGWMKGLGIDDQVTDVHYRSLSGEGNFNWRFVFKFDYLKAEDKIVYKIKDSPFAIDEMEIKSPCKLFLQVWDADVVMTDDFLGGLELFLSKIPRGAKSSQSCGLHQLNKDGTIPTINIFKNKRYRGWWPFTAENEDDPNQLDVTGKLDAEFQLLTKDEADATPVGLGRQEPNPLPPPNRPDSSFLSLMNPLKALKYLICNKFKWFLIKLLIITAIVALFVLFVYNSPGYLSKRMMGA